MFLFFFASYYCNSQNVLSGYIRTPMLEPIPNCSILIKSEDNIILTYTITNKDGFYSLELPTGKLKLFVETSILTYTKSIKKISVEALANKNYQLNFDLKERLTNLEEVYIKSDKPPISIKKDTTAYSINEFKDGSERVVEDILKKLPGIIVSSDGLIKFKGKQVTRILLDGDNIFNENYTIGTKNIDSDIVESIQAIENYNSNHLLKGVKSSQDVAVNLTLKKNITDISFNTEIGLGIENKKRLKANTISVSKKLKGFSTLSYNNIGENYSPFNFNSNVFDIAKINEANQRIPNLIKHNREYSILTDKRTSVNNNFFGSLNTLYKINNKVSIKLNYNLFTDKLKRNEASKTNYIFDSNNIEINTNKNTVMKTKNNSLQYELIYVPSKTSLLTIEGKLDIQDITSDSNGFNNVSPFENIKRSNNLFLKNKLEYTYKFNTKSVFQLVSNLSTNKIPESINVFSESENLIQEINLKKNLINLEAKLLTKRKKSEYSISLGYNHEENFIKTELEGLKVNNQFLSNDVNYKLSNFYFDLNYKYRINKWRFNTRLKNEVSDITINDINLSSNNIYKLLFNPKFSINYYINKNNYLYSSYNISNKAPKILNIYSGLILTNQRLIINNDFNFKIFNNHLFNFGYRINDFYNLFQFNIYGKYGLEKYGYISKLNVGEKTDFYTSILDITNNKNLTFGIELEKYIDFFKSTVNFNTSYSTNEYQNIINDSSLRNNKNKSLNAELDIRTGFKGPINFSNKTLLRFDNYENSSNTSSSITPFQNDFTIKYIANNFQLNVNSQYFSSNLKSDNSGNMFLDIFAVYKPKKGKLEYQIRANNLLNKKVYRNFNSSDYSTSIFEHNLIERFALFSIGFKF